MRSNGSPKTCKTPRGGRGHRGHRGQLSHEKDPGELIAIGDYTTWFTGDYDGPHSREAYQPTSIMRWDRGIFNGSAVESERFIDESKCRLPQLA